MALSNRTLSGCSVSLVMGFSYFLRWNPQPLLSRTAASAAIPIFLVLKFITLIPYDVCLTTITESDLNVYHPGRLRQVLHLRERRRRIPSAKNGGPGHHPLYPGLHYFAHIAGS